MTPDGPELTADTVRDLLRAQHPDLAERSLRLGARGWDNQLWRLGDDLAVRLPWATPTADALLLKEHTWLPVLAPRLPLPVPVPQRLGAPSARFPRPWIVTTWVPGAPGDQAPATRGPAAADALGAFLTALHRPAPEDAPTGRERGGPLAPLAGRFEHGLASAVEQGLLPDPETVRAMRSLWADAVAAPAWSGPAVWLHGDLHPANVLTADGTFCGVIDFGDLCAGDPACDLAAAWTLLPDGALDRFHTAYRPGYRAARDPGHVPAPGPAPDTATLRRARGWALLRALGCLLIGEAGRRGRPGGKPSWAPPARAALRRIVPAR
ncbi:aminoglycoside phosphotransferase family protein [Streptomyces sp. SUK 48]|uniref:aminoglycoside phosphotransferase family protein n=1 Tax=Streptomyces sp. SUK 48 TaxID=2582831 RepID=UPI00129A727D|nr:aminoglycoside phosphotransferase family protein [Streptomyces sp. SUK 48]